MDEANTLKVIAVKAVESFQQAEDLLRYLAKQNLENLDLEDVDKEICCDLHF